MTASDGISSFDDILRATIAASIFDSPNDRNRVDPGASVHGAPRSAHSATLFEIANASLLLDRQYSDFFRSSTLKSVSAISLVLRCCRNDCLLFAQKNEKQSEKFEVVCGD